MFEARLFGIFQLTAPDGSNATPIGRKARALLAHLLLAGGEGVPRDRLAGLLWGERSDEQARASLRQTLYEMRALAAGDAPLLVFDRTQARIAAERVRSDIDQMRAASRGNDAAATVEQVTHRPRELLIDLEAIDSGFDEWLAQERVRRADERRSMMMSVADAALGSGDAAGAQALATAALTIDPLDERAARLAMAACAASGDRDGVRQIFLRLEQALRTDLGAEPSDETAVLHRTLMAAVSTPLPARVMVDAPAVPLVASHVAAASFDRAPTIDPARGATALAHWRRGAALLALLMLCVSAAWWWSATTRAGNQRVLLVRPLDVAPGDDKAQTLRLGLSSGLARMIVGNETKLSVVDPDDPARAAARRVDFIVNGSARSSGDSLHADIRITHGDDPAILWSTSFTRPAGDVDAMREQMSSKVADVVICALGGRNPSIDELGLATLRLYMGACEQKHGDWNESAKLLQQVVARQPKFAHGWAMLAAGTATAAIQRPDEVELLHKQAETYAQHALTLDPNDGEAYYARAESLAGMANWSRRMAVLEVGHAVDPTNAPTNVLTAYSLAQVGRWREARAYAQQAFDFDPFSAGQASLLSRLTAFGGDIDKANAILEVGRQRFPKASNLARNEFRIDALVGDTRRALAMLDDAARPLGMNAERVAMWKTIIAVRTDHTDAARDRAARAVLANLDTPGGGGLPAVERLVFLGRVDEAYAVADKIGRDPDGEEQLLFTSVLASFRADPRFMTIAARRGLATIWLQTNRWPDFCDDGAPSYDCRIEARRALSMQPRLLTTTPAAATGQKPS